MTNQKCISRSTATVDYIYKLSNRNKNYNNWVIPKKKIMHLYEDCSNPQLSSEAIDFTDIVATSLFYATAKNKTKVLPKTTDITDMSKANYFTLIFFLLRLP